MINMKQLKNMSLETIKQLKKTAYNDWLLYFTVKKYKQELMQFSEMNIKKVENLNLKNLEEMDTLTFKEYKQLETLYEYKKIVSNVENDFFNQK